MILSDTFSGTEPPISNLGTENAIYHQVLTDGRITLWIKRSGTWTISSDAGTASALSGHRLNEYFSCITLTNDQIKTLPTTAIEVVAAQGANTIIVPTFCILYLNWVADYDNIGNTGRLGIEYSGQGSSMLAPLDESASEVGNLLVDGASHPAFLPPRSTPYDAGGGLFRSSGVGQFIDDPGTINTALNIYAVNQGTHTGNYTSGDAGNTLQVGVTYNVFNISTRMFV